jgi:metal-responsive CopG/Arc/MetJ family transcriptional regulator
MNIKDFLKAHPLPQSDPKTRRVFEQVEKINLALNNLDLNQRSTYYMTIDNARLEEVSKAANIAIRKPDTIISAQHIYLVHEKGMVVLRGPEMRITETFKEI